jgi:8-oxo-dGTP pyrophosphatase MutT (NUDIX family)
MFAIEDQIVGHLCEEAFWKLLHHRKKNKEWQFFVSKDQLSWRTVDELLATASDEGVEESAVELLSRLMSRRHQEPVSFKISLQGRSVQARSSSMAKLLGRWRERNIFRVLVGWRHELYPIYGAGKELLCNVERAGSSLFGIVTYGVHMTVYVRSQDELKIWVPRRAANKQTWPGKLDNSVAGGLSSGEQPFACLVREAAEEASLPEDLVRKGARSCGIVSCYYLADPVLRNGRRIDHPECEYVYDLEVDESTILKPSDSEVESFRLMTVEEVQKAMYREEFKPNCAMVLLDFFIRHGILTAENEPDFFEICTRLHRRLPFPII